MKYQFNPIYKFQFNSPFTIRIPSFVNQELACSISTKEYFVINEQIELLITISDFSNNDLEIFDMKGNLKIQIKGKKENFTFKNKNSLS